MAHVDAHLSANVFGNWLRTTAWRATSLQEEIMIREVECTEAKIQKGKKGEVKTKEIVGTIGSELKTFPDNKARSRGEKVSTDTKLDRQIEAFRMAVTSCQY